MNPIVFRITKPAMAAALLLAASLSFAGGQTYSIKAKATKGGTISPVGKISVLAGQSQTFTITPSTGYDNTKIVANKVTYPGAPSYTFENVQANGAIKAFFKVQTFTLTFSASDGIKIVPPESKIAKYGSKVKIKLTPPAGAVGTPILTIDGSPVTLLGGPKKYSYLLTVTGAHVVHASLNAAPQHTLSVSKDGTGSGTVTSNPAGISCGATCSGQFTEGSVITLTPSATAGSTFAGWAGACTGTGACQVTLNADASVTATFNTSAAVQRTLTVGKSGNGTGTVTSNPVGIDCGSTCSGLFDQGTVITLTANAALVSQFAPEGTATSTFTGWSGGGCSGTGVCQVTLNANTTVTANFTLNAATQRTLTVSKAGTGTGSVTSNPAGISCGATCNHQYDDGTAVTLTASPTGGSTFAGWSGGGCTGAGTCQVTLNADTTVTATFDPPGGGGSLSALVTDSCGAPAIGAIVAVHNANGTINTTITVVADGVVDLSTFGSTVTFTVGWPNAKGVENAEIWSFVGVPNDVGQILVPLEGGNCTPTDPVIGSVTVNLNPAPALFGNVYPLPGSWQPANHVLQVLQSSLQDDSKLSLLAVDGFPVPPATTMYGFLLDQTFTNGATYNIDLDKSPTDLPYSGTNDIQFVSIIGSRKGESFVLGSDFLATPATSGSVSVFDQFPATSFIESAGEQFALDTFGFPYSQSTWTRIASSLPASLTIPALFNITDLTFDGTADLITWTLSNNSAGKLGVVGFSNVQEKPTVDDRHWSIILDPTSGSHTSWAESNLVLPSELSIAGRTVAGPSMRAYELSYIHSYSDAIKQIYAGGVTPPAPPYDTTIAFRTVPPAAPLRPKP